MRTFTIKNGHFFLIGLLVLPIILSGYYYIDDIGRSSLGYTLWSTNGRPITELLFIILSQGRTLIDISPLTYIISIFVLGFSASIILDLLKIDCCYYKLIIGASFALNPFMIEVLSYRYDSLSMALSILFTCLSVKIGWKDGLNYNSFIKSSALLTLTMCTYQPSIGIYIAFSIFEVVYKVLNTNYKLTQTLKRILVLIFVQIIYIFLISKIFVTGDYNTTHGELTFNPYNIINNAAIYYNLFSSSYGGFFPFVYILMAIGIIFTSIKSLKIISGTKKNSYSRIFTIFISATFPFLLLISPVLSIIFLKEPVISPRILISFGAVLFISIYCVYVNFYRAGYILIGLLAASSLSLYYAYGNALASQNILERNYANDIAKVISNQIPQPSNLIIKGYMNQSQIAVLYSSRFPIIGKTISPVFKQNWMFSSIYLSQYGINIGYKPFNGSKEDFEKYCSSELLKQNSNYSIFKDGDDIFLSFDKCNY